MVKGSEVVFKVQGLSSEKGNALIIKGESAICRRGEIASKCVSRDHARPRVQSAEYDVSPRVTKGGCGAWKQATLLHFRLVFQTDLKHSARLKHLVSVIALC